MNHLMEHLPLKGNKRLLPCLLRPLVSLESENKKCKENNCTRLDSLSAHKGNNLSKDPQEEQNLMAGHHQSILSLLKLRKLLGKQLWELWPWKSCFIMGNDLSRAMEAGAFMDHKPSPLAGRVVHVGPPKGCQMVGFLRG